MNTGFKTIVVGYEGAVESEDALALALDVASEDSQVIAVDVVELTTSAHSIGYGVWENLMLAGAEANLEHLSSRMETHTAFAASAAQGLREVATERDADLIVVGSCHRCGLGRLLAGSTGERLIRHAPCAVLVAPRGYASPGDGELRETTDVDAAAGTDVRRREMADLHHKH